MAYRLPGYLIEGNNEQPSVQLCRVPCSTSKVSPKFHEARYGWNLFGTVQYPTSPNITDPNIG